MKKGPGAFGQWRLQGGAAALAVVLILGVLPPAKAYAQCEQFATANLAMTNLATADTNKINAFIRQEKNFIDNDLSKTATFEIEARLEEFDVNIRNWLSHWWEKRLKPSMKAMTKQLSVAKIHQTFAMGTMIDAQLLNEMLKRKQELADEAYRRYIPSELACQSTSVGGEQTRAYQMAGAINRGFAKDLTKQSGNAKGTDSATGRGAEIKKQWEEYVAKFCDNTKGDQGCTTPGIRAGMHKDIPSLLWGNKQTIDFTDPENVIMVKAAMRYLVYPASPDPIPPGAVESGSGHEAILNRRSSQARSNAALNVIGRMLGERVGVTQNSEAGQSMATTFRAMRRLAGTNDENISPTPIPSYSELREVTTKERFLNPQYITNMISDPGSVVREQASINATRLQLMNDLYRRNEEMLFMEAAAYARDLDQQKPSSAVSAAPVAGTPTPAP